MFVIPVDIPATEVNTVTVAEHQTIRSERLVEHETFKLIKSESPQKWIVRFEYNTQQPYEPVPQLNPKICYEATGYASPEGETNYNLMLSAIRSINVAEALRSTGVRVFAKAGGVNEDVGRAVIIKEASCER